MTMSKGPKPNSDSRPIGTRDFSVAATIEVPDRSSGQRLGDVAAAYDPAAHRGWTLGFLDGSPCGNYPNDRELAFTLDAGSAPSWEDLGQPSRATIMVTALAVLDGALYAATWEGPPSNRGHVYRLDGGEWHDCGSPWDCNAVSRLAVLDGALLAGVSRLRGGGSGMPDSPNQGPGGHVLRYEGGTDWTDLGGLPDADSIAALVPWRADLYAIPMYSEGLYRLVAPGSWASCGSPGRRLLALGVHDGALLGAGNDHADVDSAIAQTAAGIVVPARSPIGGGGVFRYDGEAGWTSLGMQPDTTQVYSIETFDGALHIGTWPNGLVFRHDGAQRWSSRGRLGDETEVMNLLAYGGNLLAGTLPSAQVFRMDGPDRWAEIGRLDWTPDVLYRRAASMAVHRGRLVVGTLPSGRIHALRLGAGVSTGTALAPGRHAIVAGRRASTLELHVDGVRVATETDLAGVLDLGEAPGPQAGGPRAPFAGQVLELRVDTRA